MKRSDRAAAATRASASGPGVWSFSDEPVVLVVGRLEAGAALGVEAVVVGDVAVRLARQRRVADGRIDAGGGDAVAEVARASRRAHRRRPAAPRPFSSGRFWAARNSQAASSSRPMQSSAMPTFSRASTSHVLARSARRPAAIAARVLAGAESAAERLVSRIAERGDVRSRGACAAAASAPSPAGPAPRWACPRRSAARRRRSAAAGRAGCGSAATRSAARAPFPSRGARRRRPGARRRRPCGRGVGARSLRARGPVARRRSAPWPARRRSVAALRRAVRGQARRRRHARRQRRQAGDAPWRPAAAARYTSSGSCGRELRKETVCMPVAATAAGASTSTAAPTATRDDLSTAGSPFGGGRRASGRVCHVRGPATKESGDSPRILEHMFAAAAAPTVWLDALNAEQRAAAEHDGGPPADPGRRRAPARRRRSPRASPCCSSAACRPSASCS